ncbi:ATP-binding protein [Streptomyces sp. NRRL F-5123]|uniref:ATP-binding protein n=1 Tax=Streptomyces sp. NRRL F-5123 TaxID=1463856 RepID=UPI0007C44C0A|nr:ATP-binding protein [Streptomyces sp. NRRL F-5123]
MSAHPSALVEARVSATEHPAAAARRAVARVLDRVPGCTERARGDAELVASELVSNAVRHGGGLVALRVGLTQDGSGVWLEAEDATPQRPEARRTLGEDAFRAGGFGWPIVLRLAASVRTEDVPGGKRIRVVLPVT